MDETKFLNACKLRDEQKFTEACDEFIQLAESETEPLDKAGASLYAANTLEISGQVEAAMGKLSEAQALMVIEVNMANGASRSNQREYRAASIPTRTRIPRLCSSR
jgi:hypothetical protein